MESLMQKIDEKQDAKISALEARIMKEMESLKLRQTTMEKEASTWASRDGGSTVGGSMRNAAVAASYGFGNNTKQEHCPRKVDIKGLANWDKREEEGLTQPEAC
eukprot:6139056-Heterocapsa_arctica.AAC.1